MTTVARLHSSNGARWYTPQGEPCYEIMGKTTGKPRPVNLGDARKQGLLPSVTTVLGILDKPELTNWKIEQAVLAVLTTPRQPGEADDAFVNRVLRVEKVQEQERDTAAEKGRIIHDALELYCSGRKDQVPAALLPYVEPAAAEVFKRCGQYVTSEKVLVGGTAYAGRTDLITKSPECWWILDWKTTKTLPTKGAWRDHVIQIAAYAAAFWTATRTEYKPVRTANCYVSTLEPGKFYFAEHDPDWRKVYDEAWKPLLALWQWINNYPCKPSA